METFKLLFSLGGALLEGGPYLEEVQYTRNNLEIFYFCLKIFHIANVFLSGYICG